MLFQLYFSRKTEPGVFVSKSGDNNPASVGQRSQVEQ